MSHDIKVERADAGARRVIVSANPHSGAYDRRPLIDELVKRLEAKKFEVEQLGEIDQVCKTANRWLEEGTLRAVIAAGGDGTAALLANRLPATVPLVIFPLGTANLLAKYLTLDRDVEQIANTIEQGQIVHLDAGTANGHFFLVVTGCGFDAEVVRRLHHSRKGHISYFTYLAPIFRSLGRYRYPALEITFDNGERWESVRWAFIQNIPRYAMNLSFAKEANPFDGQLDLCTFRSGGFLSTIYYFFCSLLGIQNRIRSARFARFKSMTIRSEGAVHYEVDGDPGGKLPLAIEVVPDRLRVMVPPGWIEEQQRKMDVTADENSKTFET